MWRELTYVKPQSQRHEPLKCCFAKVLGTSVELYFTEVFLSSCSGTFAYSDSLLWQVSSKHWQKFEDVNEEERYLEVQVPICADAHIFVNNPACADGSFESLVGHTIRARPEGFTYCQQVKSRSMDLQRPSSSTSLNSQTDFYTYI